MQLTNKALIFSLFICSWIVQGEAGLIKIHPPSSFINSPQTVELVIVSSNGSVYRQSAFYDPNRGGIDMDASWAGPNASIYIPSWGVGYVWHDGFWVDEGGYYWIGPDRFSIDVPGWTNIWDGYWGRYWNDRRGYWHRSGWHHRDLDRQHGDWRDHSDHWKGRGGKDRQGEHHFEGGDHHHWEAEDRSRKEDDHHWHENVRDQKGDQSDRRDDFRPRHEELRAGRRDGQEHRQGGRERDRRK